MGAFNSLTNDIDKISDDLHLELFAKYILDPNEEGMVSAFSEFLINFNPFLWASFIVLSNKCKSFFKQPNIVNNNYNEEEKQLVSLFVIESLDTLIKQKTINQISTEYPISFQNNLELAWPQTIAAAIYCSLNIFKWNC